MRRILFVIALALYLIWPGQAKAGFGVSPAYIVNESAAPGSTFEQQVVLSRSNAESELNVSVELPKRLSNWISVKQGNSFVIPAGATQFPVNVIFRVPGNADYDLYEDVLSFVGAAPTSTGGGSGVSVALGGTIKLKIKVTDKEVYDFRVTAARVLPLEVGWPVQLGLTLQNSGNVRARPSKVRLNVYDDYHSRLIFSEDIYDLGWVEPFSARELLAQTRASLGQGQYWMEYEVYKMGEPFFKGQWRFEVLPQWTLVKRPWTAVAKEYLGKLILASPIRIMIATFAATLFFVGVIVLVVWLARRRRHKVRQAKEVKANFFRR